MQDHHDRETGPALVVEPEELAALDLSPATMAAIPGSRMFEIRRALEVFRQRDPESPTYDASQGDGGESLEGVPEFVLEEAHRLQREHGSGYDQPFGAELFRRAVVEDYWQLDPATGWGPANVMLAPGAAAEAWALTPEAIRRSVSAAVGHQGRRVAMLVITSPDNPTGAFLSEERQLVGVLSRAMALAGACALSAAIPVAAAISGQVVDDLSNLPIAGALVRVQADPSSPVVVSESDGSFSLPVEPVGFVVVAAAVPYDRLAPLAWTTAGTLATAGASGVVIRLRPVPAADNPGYPAALPLVTDCQSCHPEQVAQWSSSVHAGAGTDVWVLDLLAGTGTPGGSAGYVFRDTHDPDESGFCATCHNPMADVFDPGNVFMDEVTDPAGLEGVSCVACHQVDAVDGPLSGLHHLGSSTYRFPEAVQLPTSQHVWGPLPDASFLGMATAYAPVYGESRYCASCHEYVNPANGAPGQHTFSEWAASPYAAPGPGFRSCQDCHMPDADGPGTVAAIGDAPERPADQRHAHDMIGATPQSLADAILLDTVAWQDGSLLRVRATVTNAGAGHAFPSGISIRNALLVVEARLEGAPLVQVSGPTVPWWADDEVPGVQDGDYAGRPGTGFAKVLEGRINGQGDVVRPVLFIDAEGVAEDSLLPAAGVSESDLTFALPTFLPAGASIEVEARLLYRRAWRALAVTKGWTTTPQGGPIEIEVARDVLGVAVSTGQVGDIPTMGPLGATALVLLIAGVAVLLLRRRAPQGASGPRDHG